ncbi:MAG TPA: GAF domain-containing protein [Acidimicrobiales bacterium]|nr:GAF domain-containing protein [Acidimicrobiales bacterium]
MTEGRLSKEDDREGGFRRQVDIEELLEIERASGEVVQPVARLWHELVTSADQAVTPRSLEAVLRGSLATIGRLLSVNSVAILLANEAGDELMARAAIGLSEEFSMGVGIKIGQGMSGQVLASRQPLVVGDLAKIEVVNPVLRNSGLRSIAAVPMVSDGHPLGVVWAGSYEEDRFTLADAELLQVVADRLASAVDRVRAFERERTARHEAERLADRTARIQRATADLAAAHSPGECSDALVRVLESEVPLWRGVWVLQEDGLELVAQSGDLPPGWNPSVEVTDDTPPASALRDGRALYGPGDRGDGGSDLFPADDEPGSSAGSWAVLPIVTRDGPIGVLALVTERSGWFTADERLLLALVVDQAAQAFERAHLVESERRAAERAAFFARAAQVLAEAGDLAETLERLGDLAVTTIGEICLIDVVSEESRLARMVARHRDPALQPLVERLRSQFAPDPNGMHPAVRAITTGQVTWSKDMPDEFLRATTVSEEHFALVRALGFRSYLTVPLVASGRVVGSVTCISTSQRFHRGDVTFAEELARHVASVVDNARRYESAFRTSQILQSSLLPARLPDVDGVTVETRYLTANRGLEVWGDFYDVLMLPTGAVLFMVGDVAGHDRAAAAQMGHLRSAARALAGHAGTPASLGAALRAAWRLLGFERIATAIFGLLDVASGDLVVASAGHYPPLLVAPHGAEFLPVVPGPPLGVDAPPPAEWRGSLRPGQVLLGYTDGAIDERTAGSDKSMADLARVAAAGELTPLAVCDRLVAAIASERADDVALIALAVGRR